MSDVRPDKSFSGATVATLAQDEATAAQHALSIAIGAMSALRTQVDQLAKGELEDDGVRLARADHETAAEAVHAALALLHGRAAVADALATPIA